MNVCDLLRIQDNLSLEYTKVKVAKYSVEYAKLWGSQERNLNGSVRATLRGILTNVKVTTEPMKRKSASEVADLLNQPYISVKFYDTLTGETEEGLYIASDITMELIQIAGEWYNSYDFTLSPIDVRGFIS